MLANLDRHIRRRLLLILLVALVVRLGFALTRDGLTNILEGSRAQDDGAP